jgi:tRNA pseudouridine55 synthase
MTSRPERLDGLILLDKPPGMTSHDCVAEVRKLCPRKFKVGHGGTLDPFCTGLLILLMGKATRLASFLQGMTKAYEGVIRFGQGTDTFDRDGKVTFEGPLPSLTAEQWGQTATAFVGPAFQRPPSFSAKRVGRVRAYELARQGVELELEPVKVEIFKFDVSPLDEMDLHFTLKCSSGTYVRALARDLGEKAGSPCHCYQLCRTEVGPFTVHDTNHLEDPFASPGFVPFDLVDLGFPVYRVSARDVKLILFGQKILAPPSLRGHEGFLKIAGPTGRFLAVGRLEARQIHPAVVFPESS